MTLTDVLTIAAILLAPFVAVHVQKRLEDHRNRTDSRREIFRVLMATRLARLAPEHVHALNRIDIEFMGVEQVQGAWRDLLHHLNTQHPGPGAEPAQIAAWDATEAQLFSNLLFELSRSLGYKFDRNYLRSTAYRPQAYQVEEQLQRVVRWGLAQLMTGNYSLPVRLMQPAPPPEQEGATRDEELQP